MLPLLPPFRRPQRPLIILGILAIGVAPIATAQNATAAANSDSASAISLDPFEVRTDKDRGYLATDTISGSRLSTNLLKTPADVSVLTKDFLDDIAVFNIADAEGYLTNSAPAAPAVGAFTFGADVSFRGLPTAVNVRNYFSYPLTPNNYIVDRVEGARGTNSILYGPSLSGGLVNILTKQAQFYQFGTLQYRLDSFGTKSVAIDINQPVNDKLAVRINATEQALRSWIQGYYDDLSAGDLAATYRPWKGAEIRLEAEVSNRKVAYVPNYFVDDFSAWTGTPVTGPITTAPAGVTKNTNSAGGDYLVVSPNWAGVMNFLNYGRSTGTGLSVVNEDRPFNGFPVLAPKSFRDEPADAFYDIRNTDLTLIADQTLPSGLVLEGAIHRSDCPEYNQYANEQATYVDVNQVLPNGQANPEYGKLYGESTLNVGPLNQYRTEGRVAVAYQLPIKAFTQSISAIASDVYTIYDPRVYTYGRINGISANPNNDTVKFRRYWDGNPDAPLGVPADEDGDQFGYYMSRDTRSTSTLESAQVNSIGSYFHDTLTVIGGIRRDNYVAFDRELGTINSTTGLPANMVTTGTTSWHTTRNIGFVYFPEEYVGVYASYSEGFNPQIPQYPRLNGQQGINSTGDRGHSAGIRFKLLNGRIVGSLGYYDAHEGDRTQAISTTAVNQIWTDLNLPQSQIIGGSYPDYLDSFDYKARGLETDIVANLTDNLQLMANGALPKTEQANSLPDTNAYYAANIAQWTAGTVPSSGLSTATQNQIAADIQSIQSVITNGAGGRVVNGTYEWRVNGFAKYTFSSSLLKGLSVGFGGNLFGRQEIGSPANEPFVYLYTSAYATAAGLLEYSFKIHGEKVTLQLNGQNLFDYTRPIYSSVTTLNSVAYRNAYYYNPPRNIVLTVKLGF